MCFIPFISPSVSAESLFWCKIWVGLAFDFHSLLFCLVLTIFVRLRKFILSGCEKFLKVIGEMLKKVSKSTCSTLSGCRYLGYTGSTIRCFFKKWWLFKEMEDLSVVKILNQCFDPWDLVALEISRSMGVIFLSFAGLLPSFVAIPGLS